MTDPDGARPAGGPGPSPLRPYVSGEFDLADGRGAAAAADQGAGASAARLPPYLLTGGRARPVDQSLEIEAQVLATAVGQRDAPRLPFESRDIVASCQRPLAVAELAARLGLHLGVARVLVGDLVTTGHLTVRRPESDRRRRAEIIERVIRGLASID